MWFLMPHKNIAHFPAIGKPLFTDYKLLFNAAFPYSSNRIFLDMPSAIPISAIRKATAVPP